MSSRKGNQLAKDQGSLLGFHHVCFRVVGLITLLRARASIKEPRVRAFTKGGVHLAIVFLVSLSWHSEFLCLKLAWGVSMSNRGCAWC